ncbi:LOW QUALITY PROTEIN: ubiquitin carboxyl-terminal hydrolase 34 [Bemisia tabaci]
MWSDLIVEMVASSQFLHTLFKEKNVHPNETLALSKQDVQVVINFIQQWMQRQCICCFRDPKHYDIFHSLTQSIVLLTINLMKCYSGDEVIKISKNVEKEGYESKVFEDIDMEDQKDTEEDTTSKKDEPADKKLDEWTIADLEKLLHFLTKVFLLNFPLYMACKQENVHSKGDIITSDEANNLSTFCDLHDLEVPVYLLRNVSLFSRAGGVQAMTYCFGYQSLPIPVAHAMISVVCNLKLWLNYRTIVQLFVPLRASVLRYMCLSMSDKQLRTPGIKSMADFMWTAVKDPMDTPLTFDREGLDLAFKYFTSSTLTMRLAGIAQINTHINMYTELMNSSSCRQSTCGNNNNSSYNDIGHSLAVWLIENDIVSHIFGPNLHVEVIKQSHIILNFLAMECKLTNDHIDIIWQAAQLKHCSKQVLDLLPPLINNMEVTPVLHLYNLLCQLSPKNHTEQTLYLASGIIKFIWTNCGVYSANIGPIWKHLSVIQKRAHDLSSPDHSPCHTQSDDEPVTISDAHLGPPNNLRPKPCKRRKAVKPKSNSRQRSMIENAGNDSSDESVKLEEFDKSEVENVKKLPRPFLEAAKLLPKKNLLKSKHRESVVEVVGMSDDDCDRMSTKLQPRMKQKKPVKQRVTEGEAESDESEEVEQEDEEDSDSDEDDDDDDDESSDEMEHYNPVPMKEGSPLSDHQVPDIMLRQGNSAEILELVSSGVRLSQQKKKFPQQKSLANSPERNLNVMSELASLVQGPPLLPFSLSEGRSLDPADFPPRELVEETLSGDENGSLSSQVSNKSEKNMGDFDGDDDSVCDDEIDFTTRAQICEQALRRHNVLDQMVYPHQQLPNRPDAMSFLHGNPNNKIILPRDDSVKFHLEDVCKPGSTLLWDLLQDDKIVHLGEGLALEAEKALCNLVCYNTEKLIRMKFIEGCLENLEANRSVVISLRLLPKLFASFTHSRGANPLSSNTIVLWALRNHALFDKFFNNLITYTQARKKQKEQQATQPDPPPFYSHTVHVQVRLQFLTHAFSSLCLPRFIRLSIEQIDILWNWLATDEECSDELFNWLLKQFRMKDPADSHALSYETLLHLYTNKLPTLSPYTISMTALRLYQHLCDLMTSPNHPDRAFSDKQEGSTSTKSSDAVALTHIWKIALRAYNTDVSMAAIQYLNNYYMVSRQLSREEEFINNCMSHLSEATSDLRSNEESSLQCIQRALLLLMTHLGTFRKRYAYHLRRWYLEGCNVSNQIIGKDSMPLKIVVQCAGSTEKITLHLFSTDYVAELRAEIGKIWQCVMSSNDNSDKNSSSNIDGLIRMITQGQELTTDFDEKTLQDVGFKDGQMLFISLGNSRCKKRSDVDGNTFLTASSNLPPPPKDCLPTLLLLLPHNFEQLFQLMETLSRMKTTVKGGHHMPHTKAQVLSRRVWDILMLIPTNPTLLSGFQNLESRSADDTTSNDIRLTQLLDPASPHKLMYSLRIVESLCHPQLINTKHHTHNEDENQNSSVNWSGIFVRSGGLRQLFDIFMSGVLLDEKCNEWQQDCLAQLLKLICQLSMADSDEGHYNIPSLSQENTPNILRHRRKRCNKNMEKVVIPKLNDEMLSMMNVETVMPYLIKILYQVSSPRDPNYYRTGFWGRAQVIHYAMALLVSWSHSVPFVKTALLQTESFDALIQRLVLEEPEPDVRREICTTLYHLNLPSEILTLLLCHLDNAMTLCPPRGYRHEGIHSPMVEESNKEPYGSSCRDYFWLLCRLVDSLPADVIKEESTKDGQHSFADLAEKVAKLLYSREFFEQRHENFEDDCLIGLLNLMSHILKHDPPFKTSANGLGLIDQLFDFLFALPDAKNRHVPKCKMQHTRSCAFDCLVEMVKSSPSNYKHLHSKLLVHHQPGPHSPYPWDYWPHEESRSECGYVGLTNLGATCYLASCIQHLFMIPQARESILSVNITDETKHSQTLYELQRMFAYLLESERKSYDPRSFCRVYTMYHQPLNTGEQKDMAEFFIDLVSKLEEMDSDLKSMVKTLFGGVISNNVVSLDCEHVSCTLEEFYTVRCQVADMRNLYASLDEVTLKDTLEGDNMYTCSQCGRKVRAEKRACFKKLPQILCFNTMRYTFNMVTMLKEKVNTHFSFPMRLDMSGYVEKYLMPQQYQEEHKQKDGEEDNESSKKKENYEYELIGITVHTGSADSGHYYCFIRDRENKSSSQFSSPSKSDRNSGSSDKWYLFNDAEVKHFNPNQIAAECFGGEMMSKTYDTVTDKFMDLSFEKTNSAYMLFYELTSEETLEEREKNEKDGLEGNSKEIDVSPNSSAHVSESPKPIDSHVSNIKLSADLENWIWEDNRKFLHDKNIFEHTYFQFMWQICGYIPQTMENPQELTEIATQLSTSFILETFIHAKEKPTMVQWVELLTKQFDTSSKACQWFLTYMSETKWWPIQILIKCNNQMVRQMFQRLCIHVINRLKQSTSNYKSRLLLASDRAAEQDKKSEQGSEENEEEDYLLCIKKFIASLVSLIEKDSMTKLSSLSMANDKGDSSKQQQPPPPAMPHILNQLPTANNVTEFYSLLYDISKQEPAFSSYLLQLNTISVVVLNFHLLLSKFNNKSVPTPSGVTRGDPVEVVSDEDDDDDDDMLATTSDKYRPTSLDKMVTLVASLVEKSYGPDQRLHLSPEDYAALVGGKGFPFLCQQIKESINPHQTRNLIFSLTRWNDNLATQIINVIFNCIQKYSCNMDMCQPFFKILSTLVETPVGSPHQQGLPCFTQLILPRMWEIADVCPQSVLDWFTFHVTCNKIIHCWVLQSVYTFTERYLMAHNNQRVRAAAAYLLVCLVPNQLFRQLYQRSVASNAALRSPSLLGVHHKQQMQFQSLSQDALLILHQILNYLLRLMKQARIYSNISMHGPSKLVAYFSLLQYFTISQTEKLMFGPYFLDLWNVFHPKLSEPAIPILHNKQILLNYWYHVLQDCPENVQLILQNQNVVKNIAFNYILADHEDQEILLFNRIMLPAYYGILKLCCMYSKQFTKQLLHHQNIIWAFKNILPYPQQYPLACEELLNIMKIFVKKYPDLSEANRSSDSEESPAEGEKSKSSNSGEKSSEPNVESVEIDKTKDEGSSSTEPAQEEKSSEESKTVEVKSRTEDEKGGKNEGLKMLKRVAAAEESAETDSFKLSTLKLLMTVLDGHHSYSTIINIFNILLESDFDKIICIQNNGFMLLFDSFQTIFSIYHDSAANFQSVYIDLHHVLSYILEFIQLLNGFTKNNVNKVRSVISQYKNFCEVVKKLLLLLNTFNNNSLRNLVFKILKEFLRIYPQDLLPVIISLLTNCHLQYQENQSATNLLQTMGPYFPRRSCKMVSPHHPYHHGLPKKPVRPMIQLSLPHNLIDCPKGCDPEYDEALLEFYAPYHEFVDCLTRIAIKHKFISQSLINLSCMVGFEGVPLHLCYFPQLWLEVYQRQSQDLDPKYLNMLTNCNFFVDYVETVLLDERTSLNHDLIYQFLTRFFPKVAQQVLTDQTVQMVEKLCLSLMANRANLNILDVGYKLNGDLRALAIIYSHNLALQLQSVLNSSRSTGYSDDSEEPSTKTFVLTPPPNFAQFLQQMLLKIVKLETAMPSSPNESTDESPVKKRKLSSSKDDIPSDSKDAVKSHEIYDADDRDAPSCSKDTGTKKSLKHCKSEAKKYEDLEALKKTLGDLMRILEDKKKLTEQAENPPSPSNDDDEEDEVNVDIEVDVSVDIDENDDAIAEAEKETTNEKKSPP